MRIEGLKVVSRSESRRKNRTVSSGNLYAVSITKGLGRLADPTGRTASTSYSDRRNTKLSDAAKVARDWNLVGETISRSVARDQFVDACAKRRG